MYAQMLMLRLNGNLEAMQYDAAATNITHSADQAQAF